MPFFTFPTALQGRLFRAALLLGAFTPLAAPSRPLSAQQKRPSGDANALVRQMIASYHTLQSLEERSEARVQVGSREFLQTAVLRYKKPNFLILTTQDPDTGTYTVQADGKTLVVYSARTSVYLRRNAPPTLEAAITSLQTLSLREMGIQNAQVLSPLSFLLAKEWPNEARSFTYVGLEVYDKGLGRKAHHVTATALPRVLADLTGVSSAKPLRQKIDLWIDPVTHLAVRSHGEFAWTQMTEGPDGKKHPVSDVLAFDEVRKSTQINGPMENGSFRFDPPKGATLKYQQRKNL